jgi:hypothetical protein
MDTEGRARAAGSLASSDVDRDGRLELAMGAPGTGSPGPLNGRVLLHSGGSPIEEPARTVFQGSEHDEAGLELAW